MTYLFCHFFHRIALIITHLYVLNFQQWHFIVSFPCNEPLVHSPQLSDPLLPLCILADGLHCNYSSFQISASRHIDLLTTHRQIHQEEWKFWQYGRILWHAVGLYVANFNKPKPRTARVYETSYCLTENDTYYDKIIYCLLMFCIITIATHIHFRHYLFNFGFSPSVYSSVHPPSLQLYNPQYLTDHIHILYGYWSHLERESYWLWVSVHIF